MQFRRLNDKTINCIITREDLSENGIRINDLFERRENAVEFLKQVLTRAAREEHISLTEEFTTMRISVLPDQSISLTLSASGSPETAGNKDTDTPDSRDRDYYLFSFKTMRNLIRCASHLSNREKIASALYEDQQEGLYYLVIWRGEQADENYERQILMFNEYGSLVSAAETRIAAIREHCRLLMPENALEKLASL